MERVISNNGSSPFLPPIIPSPPPPGIPPLGHIFPIGIPGRRMFFRPLWRFRSKRDARDKQWGGISTSTKRIVRITHPIMTIAIVISARQRASVKWRRYVPALFDPGRPSNSFFNKRCTCHRRSSIHIRQWIFITTRRRMSRRVNIFFTLNRESPIIRAFIPLSSNGKPERRNTDRHTITFKTTRQRDENILGTLIEMKILITVKKFQPTLHTINSQKVRNNS